MTLFNVFISFKLYKPIICQNMTAWVSKDQHNADIRKMYWTTVKIY